MHKTETANHSPRVSPSSCSSASAFSTLLAVEPAFWLKNVHVLIDYNFISAIYNTRSEARFARLLLDCELSYCFHWVIVVVGGRVHEWCKKGSGIL